MQVLYQLSYGPIGCDNNEALVMASPGSLGALSGA